MSENSSNSASTEEAEDPPIELKQVLTEELKHIQRLRGDNGGKKDLSSADFPAVFSAFHDENLFALCLSGGGIRSATFGLGIIQSLAKHELLEKIDYLSTVSGGGYLGAWLSAWIRVEQLRCVEREACGCEEKFRAYRKAKYSEDNEDDKIKSLTDTEVVKVDDEVTKLLFAEDLFTKRINTGPEPGADRGSTIPMIGIENIQKKIGEPQFTKSTKANPESVSVRHLRQYSNYMTPKVGAVSADTWAFIGLYLRNLFLNWLIFIPLIGALVLVPRIFYAINKFSDGIYRAPGFALYLFIGGLLAGSFALAFITHNLPSKTVPGKETKFSTDAGALLLGVLPILILAFSMSILWLGSFNLIQAENLKIVKSELFFLKLVDSRLFKYIAFTFTIYLLSFLIYTFWRLLRPMDLKPDFWSIVAAAASSVASGVLLWLVSLAIFYPAPLCTYPIELYVTFAVPVFILIYLIQAAVFVALSSKTSTDADREWLARFGGWLLIAACGWILLNGIVLLGPLAIQAGVNAVKRLASGKPQDYDRVVTVIVSLITIASGTISLVGGFSSKTHAVEEANPKKPNRIFSIVLQIASVVFLSVLIAGLAYGSIILMSKFALAMHANSISSIFPWFVWTVPSDGTEFRHIRFINHAPILYILTWSLALSIFGLVMACFVNVNKFSLHGAYRDRLVRGYLGASNANRVPDSFTGFDEADNRQLHRLKMQKPFHIMNATLNLIGGDNLAWQSRKAASFTMSPLHCGSWLLGYRDTHKYSRSRSLGKCKHLRYCNKAAYRDKNGEITSERVSCKTKCEIEGKALRLGTAMAISGAAANPNMGHYSSPIVTFLLTLFNIRFGWWLGNTGKVGGRKDGWILKRLPMYEAQKFYERSSPAVAVLPLLNEILGRTSEDKRYLNITDGGHFENLALYEMILRRCKYIIVSDAAADEKFNFGEIANAIEKCRVDFGVEIKFRGEMNIHSRFASDELRKNGQRYAIADIIYPELDDAKPRKHRSGYLIYVRPALIGGEPVDISHYADFNSSFPHQSTGDQFFDEHQFEAYRALGFLTFEELIDTECPQTVEANFKSILEKSVRNEVPLESAIRRDQLV